MRIRYALMSVALVVAALAVQASPATADTLCNGASVVARVGTVVVPAGAKCVLGASDKPTYITVAPGGTLAMQGTHATQVVSRGATTIANSIVSGTVVLSGISNESSRICGTIIGGYLVVSNNSSPVDVAPTESDECPISNFVAGGVFVSGNRGPTFFNALSIFGPIYCWGNNPAPVVWAATTLPPHQFYWQCAR